MDVQRWLRRHRGYSDRGGIFILDPTLIALPDNPNYKEAALLPLDREGRYMDVKKLSLEERRRFKYTHVYKLTMLLHWSRQDDYFLFAGGHLGRGGESGAKRGEELVDQFVSEVGKGVIKVLIMDREFIEGAMITRFKRQHGIDSLVSLKSDMHVLLDVLGISRIEKVRWVVYDEVKGGTGRVVGVGRVESWEGCEVPLYVCWYEQGREMVGVSYGRWLRRKSFVIRGKPGSYTRVVCRSRRGLIRSRIVGGWVALPLLISMQMWFTSFSFYSPTR